MSAAGPGALFLSMLAPRMCWCLPCVGTRPNRPEFGLSRWNGTGAFGSSVSFLSMSRGPLPPGGLLLFSARRPLPCPSMLSQPPLLPPLRSGNFSCVDLSPFVGSSLALGLSTRFGSELPWRRRGMLSFYACVPER